MIIQDLASMCCGVLFLLGLVYLWLRFRRGGT